MAESRQRNCANENDFYREKEELKGQLNTKDSQKKCYLEDDNYKKAKQFLKEKTEKQLRLSGNEDLVRRSTRNFNIPPARAFDLLKIGSFKFPPTSG